MVCRRTFFVSVAYTQRQPMPRTRKGKSTGVTLIETIMVIVLLSAAAIVGTIFLDDQWVARRSTSAATGEVEQTLRAARNTAITNQTIVQVRRQRTGGVERLVVTKQAGPFGPERIHTIDLGSDVRLTGTPRAIRFQPTGSADRILEWHINRSSTRGTVNVTPTDGQVSKQLP